MGKIGFSPEEIQALMNEANAVQSCVETASDEIAAILKKLTGDEILGECEYKETLTETQKNVTKTLEEIADILKLVNEKVNAVGQAAGVSVSKNMMSVEEQNALIKNAMAKANG